MAPFKQGSWKHSRSTKEGNKDKEIRRGGGEEGRRGGKRRGGGEGERGEREKKAMGKRGVHHFTFACWSFIFRCT